MKPDRHAHPVVMLAVVLLPGTSTGRVETLREQLAR